MYFLLFALLLIAVLGCILFQCRRKKIICRIKEMDCCAKCTLLDELVYPFGYRFHCDHGFFSSTVDAPQRAPDTHGSMTIWRHVSRWYSTPFPSISIIGDAHG